MTQKWSNRLWKLWKIWDYSVLKSNSYSVLANWWQMRLQVWFFFLRKTGSLKFLWYLPKIIHKHFHLPFKALLLFCYSKIIFFIFDNHLNILKRQCVDQMKCICGLETKDTSFLFVYLFLDCSLVDLQCCIGFGYIAKWFSLRKHVSILFWILFPYRLLKNIE